MLLENQHILFKWQRWGIKDQRTNAMQLLPWHQRSIRGTG